MNNDNDVWDKIILVSVCLFSIIFGYAVIDSASSFKKPTLRTPTYSTPDIPKCDKEVWDRIREGCDDIKDP